MGGSGGGVRGKWGAEGGWGRGGGGTGGGGGVRGGGGGEVEGPCGWLGAWEQRVRKQQVGGSHDRGENEVWTGMEKREGMPYSPIKPHRST